MKGLLVFVVLLCLLSAMGCAWTGVTSSFTSSFTEYADENGNVISTEWKQTMKNGLFSKIDEGALKTSYETSEQTITQGSDVLGMDSTAQVEALKASVEGLASLVEALAPLISGLP